MMKMKFLALAVSGLLLVTAGASYAQQGPGTPGQSSGPMASILNILSPKQQVVVKQYVMKNEAQQKALKEALIKDQNVLINVIVSQKLDQAAMRKAIENILKDQDEAMVMHATLLNYIYSEVATPMQQPLIAKQIQGLLQQPDPHARDGF